ncbi:MAG: hypothetical protein IJ106_02290 [Parasporobacterium sp.]|nr:hypothetical protein [Parasporobacterium sp.]
MSSTGKTLVKLALAAGAAYGAYYLYKNYIKKPQTTREFDDMTSADFEVNDDAVKEESLAQKIMAAAEKQLSKI